MKIHGDTAVLEAYVDGEVTPQISAQVEAHLARCPDCRAFVEEWMTLRRAFPGREEAPPAGFARRVMAAVARHPRKRQPWRRLLAAAACLALIVLVQYGYSRHERGDGSVTLYSASGETAPNAAPEAAAGGAQEDVAADAAEVKDRAQSAEAPMMSLRPRKEEGETPETVSLSAPGLGETLEALLPDRQPEETAPGYVRYRLERQELETLLAALKERGMELPALPETGEVFWLEAYDE